MAKFERKFRPYSEDQGRYLDKINKQGKKTRTKWYENPDEGEYNMPTEENELPKDDES